MGNIISNRDKANPTVQNMPFTLMQPAIIADGSKPANNAEECKNIT